jgi:integrase
MTLDDALARYAADITPTKKGAAQERHRIAAWRRDPIASRRLVTITTADLAAWRNARLADGRAPSTIRNALTIVSQVYRVAASEWGAAVANPVAALRLPRQRPARDRRPEPGELERIGAADPVLRPWITLAVESAMRLSELTAAAGAEIAGPVVRLRDTKNGRARAVPLSTRARTALAALEPLEPGQLEHRWRRACRRAAVLGLHFHDLRHEAVSRLFERGLSAEEVMAISGHRTYSMLARYTHLRVAGLVAKLG